MYNVKFNVGKVAKELITVVVVNPSAKYMKFERVVDDKGNVSYQPALDMVKVYDAWVKAGCPTYMDLTTGEIRRDEPDTIEPENDDINVF